MSEGASEGVSECVCVCVCVCVTATLLSRQPTQSASGETAKRQGGEACRRGGHEGDWWEGE